MAKRLLNITIVADSTEELFDIEKEISAKYDVSSLIYLPDTNKLYEDDAHFRKLVKEKKNAQLQVDRYINNHNKQ